MTEAERAALYCTQAQLRENAVLARWQALAGSASAYVVRLVATEPLRHDEGWDPVERVTDSERLQAANG